ncbi:MAG: PilT/PilU family type 4a pilus ATPase, partial [Verrucomicrobiota bacterium]
RGNAHYIKGTVQACFRLISEEVPALESLGHRPTVEGLCHLRNGLVLVTGVTGSGKSTTLAAMVERISSSRSGVILSIEDPIEYVFKHGQCIVKQREVGIDTHSFSEALKFALRQDPDVILVSEMRDLETIRTAITAAETGHLVLSTLHTADAPKTLDRLIDVFPAEQQPQIVTQLANALQAVVSQRLLPNQSGEGRVLASEVMMINHAVRACIRQGKFEQIPGLLQIGGRDGMHTFDESLAELYNHGRISREVAVENANRPDELELRMEEPKKKRKLFG